MAERTELELDELPDLYLPVGTPPPALDVTRFWDGIAAISVLVRAQLAHRIAKDENFAKRIFGAFSATARLRVIVHLMESESVEVS